MIIMIMQMLDTKMLCVLSCSCCGIERKKISGLASNQRWRQTSLTNRKKRAKIKCTKPEMILAWLQRLDRFKREFDFCLCTRCNFRNLQQAGVSTLTSIFMVKTSHSDLDSQARSLSLDQEANTVLQACSNTRREDFCRSRRCSSNFYTYTDANFEHRPYLNVPNSF